MWFLCLLLPLFILFYVLFFLLCIYILALSVNIPAENWYHNYYVLMISMTTLNCFLYFFLFLKVPNIIRATVIPIWIYLSFDYTRFWITFYYLFQFLIKSSACQVNTDVTVKQQMLLMKATNSIQNRLRDDVFFCVMIHQRNLRSYLQNANTINLWCGLPLLRSKAKESFQTICNDYYYFYMIKVISLFSEWRWSRYAVSRDHMDAVHLSFTYKGDADQMGIALLFSPLRSSCTKMKFLLAIALLLAAAVVLAYAQTDEDNEWEKFKVCSLYLEKSSNSLYLYIFLI